MLYGMVRFNYKDKKEKNALEQLSRSRSISEEVMFLVGTLLFKASSEEKVRVELYFEF